MKILELRALRGRNYYHKDPLIFMQLDLGKLEDIPLDSVDYVNRILDKEFKYFSLDSYPINDLYNHTSTKNYAAFLVQHLSIALQNIIGNDLSFSKLIPTDHERIFEIVYQYKEETTALRAGEIAVEILDKLSKHIDFDLKGYIKELKTIYFNNSLDFSTQAIVNEAEKRGIPTRRLDHKNYVQLGSGKYQRRINGTLMDNTSIIGTEIADDKTLTKSILSKVGIPVAKGESALSLEEVNLIAKSLGYPLVIKPLIGNQGRGITINIENSEGLEKAYNIAHEICETVIVEKCLSGLDYRILVIDGKFVAAARREPAFIVGDGKSTVQELIDATNAEPNRGQDHEKQLSQIKIDKMTNDIFKEKNVNLHTILRNKEKLYLKKTANLSTGGIAHDVTDTVHPLNQRMAEQISRIIGLNLIGIDIISHSLEEPLTKENSGLIEVNAGPGIRMHINPVSGKKRNIAASILNMVFPDSTQHSIPIIATTGTNGKTTTTRLINHILSMSGYKVGMTSTEEVTINNIPILVGDYSESEGASNVLMDSSIDYAVLEVARGGILKSGLGYKESDVGIFLNVTGDHLGEGGINTLDQLTKLKSTVIESVKASGFAVLNADDKHVMSRLGKTKAQPILFSTNQNNEALKNNYNQGNTNITVKHEGIFIQNKEHSLTVANIKDIPITFDGKATFNIENVLAAVGASYAIGLNYAQIKLGLLTFKPSFQKSFGRMNIIDMGGFTVMIDYAHNPGAIHATGDFIENYTDGKKIRVSFGVGNRTHEDLLKFGNALAKYYDHIILCDPASRNRKLGETAKIVEEGLLNEGFSMDKITTIINEREATLKALDMAQENDLVILQVEDINQVIHDVYDFKSNINPKTPFNEKNFE